MSKQEIAVIGLGAMGSRVAARLVAAGHRVVVCSRRREVARSLEGAGATWVASPRQAAASARVVLVMVTDDEASRTVWLDDEAGAVAGLGEGSVAIECSTLSPAWVGELAAAVQERGAAFVEAPVIGSRPHAEAGQLVVLAGGDARTLAEVEALLEAFAGKVVPTGPVGTAMPFKLAVNALFATQVVAWAEALGSLERAGIQPARAVELLGATAVASPAARAAAGAIASRAFAPQFTIDLVHKDLRYFVDTATAAGASVPATAAIREVYARARTAGHGGDNITGVAQVVG